MADQWLTYTWLKTKGTCYRTKELYSAQLPAFQWHPVSWYIWLKLIIQTSPAYLCPHCDATVSSTIINQFNRQPHKLRLCIFVGFSNSLKRTLPWMKEEYVDHLVGWHFLTLIFSHITCLFNVDVILYSAICHLWFWEYLPPEDDDWSSSGSERDVSVRNHGASIYNNNGPEATHVGGDNSEALPNFI